MLFHPVIEKINTNQEMFIILYSKSKCFWQRCLPVFLLFLICGCHSVEKDTVINENDVPLLWADLALYIAKNTPANSPTFASRGFGYLGLTMYESVVNGYNNKKSLAGQLNGLKELPIVDKTKQYNWALCLNAGQAFILKNIYLQTSDENKQKIDSLEKAIEESLSEKEKVKEVIDQSVAYGKAVAAVIFEWSKTDGGHRGYLKNFDPEAKMPGGNGAWKPPYFAQTINRFPLHPHWGNNRTFIKADFNWGIPKFIQYSRNKNSEYSKEFERVYEAGNKLTQEQKEIAMWWNDDPSDTFTPPGHSFNLASIVLKAKKADLMNCAETYARVGMAVADAFIICWKIKYHYCTERPSTFVSENINGQWQSFWPDPPFPAFPSGHATQAAAVATVLAGLYGDKMNIVDDTHTARPKDEIRNVEYKTRRFQSFWQVAEETAHSRFFGGIHIDLDNRTGLQEGALVGKHINELKWDN